MNNFSSLIGPLALLFGMGLFLMIFVFAIALLMIISGWKVFTKAGKPGWAALIPIYNTVVLAEISGKPWWWGLVIPVAFGLAMVPYIGILIAIAGGVLLWIIEYSLALAFGKDSGFGVGLILLPIVFLPILAFSKDIHYTLGQSNRTQIPTSNSY